MRKSDKKTAMAKANLIAENNYLESKGLITENVFHADSIITEEVVPVRTKGRNFIYGEDHRRSAYITGDITEKEASEVLVNGGKNYYQVVIIVGLMDFQTGKPMGSWLKYVYSTKNGESKLRFNNNYTKWENFYEAVDAKFHTPFKRMQEELDNMALQMIEEKGGSTEINEAEPIEEAANSKFDLTNPDVAGNLKRDIVDVLNKYIGISYTDDAGMSNDNRVVIFNELERWVNESFSPSSLRFGKNGNEVYTNNPEQMKQYLQTIGISDYTLKGINGREVDTPQGDMNEAGAKEEFPAYHDTYGSAIDAVEDYATKRGVQLDQEDYRMSYQDGFFKPKPGDTKSDSIAISKDGKPLKKAMNVQIYGMDSGKFELNMYIN